MLLQRAFLGASAAKNRFFSDRLPGVVIERPRLEIGSIRMDAFDWYFWMAAGADIAAILSAIYDAYQLFVKPHRLTGKVDAGLFFQLVNQFGSSKACWDLTRRPPQVF